MVIGGLYSYFLFPLAANFRYHAIVDKSPPGLSKWVVDLMWIYARLERLNKAVCIILFLAENNNINDYKYKTDTNK